MERHVIHTIADLLAVLHTVRFDVPVLTQDGRTIVVELDRTPAGVRQIYITDEVEQDLEPFDRERMG